MTEQSFPYKARPTPGDIVAYFPPQKEKPMAALLLDVYYDPYKDVQVAKTLTISEVGSISERQGFHLRAQGRIFPLQRTGMETIDLTNVVLVPMVPKFFPDLHTAARKNDAPEILVFGKVDADWMGVVNGKLPPEEDWNHDLMRQLPPSKFELEAARIEASHTSIDNLRDEGGVTLRYGLYRPQDQDPS
jgi:hypothetical protein